MSLDLIVVENRPGKRVNRVDSSSGGNQREIDRQRAQSRGGKKGPKKDDGLTPEQRRERDAKALQEKMAKKSAQVAGVDVNAKPKKK